MTMQNFKTGEIVRYSNPQNEDESMLTFVVVEDRETRLLVELICSDYLKPQFCYSKEEFKMEENNKK